MRLPRLVVVLALAGGCFKPSAPAGAPCDPLAPHCPSGQACVAGVCGGTPGATDAPIDVPSGDAAVSDAKLGDARPSDAPAGDAPTSDAPVMADAMTMTDATMTADAAVVHRDYLATVANCIAPAIPDAMLCTQSNGPAQLVVDTLDSVTGLPWDSFVRFDLDGAIAGRTVTTVQLVLTATNDPKAAGPDSGEVWTVSAFTASSLGQGAPMKLAKVAASVGSVIALQTVTFSLPVGVVAANQPVYLGIYPLSADGVNYWNLAGPNPPVLHVDAQ